MSKTEHPMMSETELEAFFTAARAETPEPSAALLARISADADAEIATREAAARARRQPRRRSFFDAVIGALGGWPAVAGMVTATVAGVWFGFASPDQVNTLAGGLLWSDSTDMATSFELEDLVPGSGVGLVTIFEEEGA